jgi:hypothetical protein
MESFRKWASWQERMNNSCILHRLTFFRFSMSRASQYAEVAVTAKFFVGEDVVRAESWA